MEGLGKGPFAIRKGLGEAANLEVENMGIL